MSTPQTTFDRLKEVIIDQLAVDPDSITLDARFREDFGTDSLDDIVLVMAAEEAFIIEIDDADYQKVRTVADALALIDRLILVEPPTDTPAH